MRAAVGAVRGLPVAWLAVLLLVPSTARPAPDATAPYVARGRQTDSLQHAYHDRMERVRESLADTLRRSAPDLLPKLEPAPPAKYGYGILPRIVADAPPAPPSRPQVVRYDWNWSDTLIARENAALDRLDTRIASAASAPASREVLEALVADYKARVTARRPIDADINYNWLWQERIAANRPMFDRLQALLEADVQREAQRDPAVPRARSPMLGFDPTSFARIDEPAPHDHLVTVPLYTDITDKAIVSAFVEAVETRWRVNAGADTYRVRLTVTTTAPVAPAIGTKIDLEAHAARFPKDGAVLTTGAASLQIASGRALVLGPHDVTPRVLAHEFGHLLGFPDTYLRGYRDLGADGFQVLEFVADQGDLMSSISSGDVLAAHYEGLIAAREIQNQMQAGLNAFQRGDAGEAVARFRDVLARNPDHFGATLQLARALDQAARPEEAIVVWKRILAMAESAPSPETAATARARLARAR